MLLEEMELYATYSPWCYLQQPVHPAPGVNASYRTLLAAVDQGWQIEGVVQGKPDDRDGTEAYHFTLVHKNIKQIYQISVLAAPEVKKFIDSCGCKKNEMEQ